MKLRWILIVAGIGSTMISAAIAYALGGIDWMRNTEGAISILLFGAAILLSGTLNTGPRASSTYYMEDKETRHKRNRIVTALVIIGIPHLLLTFYLYV
ncbi:DUF5316 family protein [Paenibacillus aquistagni]|uniref:DUF5316 family protein n=1 Tax=Paenibacillus aquistagni TaxID=1852522 RepID=UPI00145A7518|nr:DUF5316 family protein [Paenibacillus aquistagni]NMM51066.1 DUF5316 domain-containing protein [Paenibacillus aquistagni]